MDAAIALWRAALQRNEWQLERSYRYRRPGPLESPERYRRPRFREVERCEESDTVVFRVRFRPRYLRPRQQDAPLRHHESRPYQRGREPFWVAVQLSRGVRYG